MAGPRIHLIAAEASGDALGAGLIAALRERTGGQAQFTGLGGALMAEQGIESPFDITELSIVGLMEGVLAYRRVLKRVDETVAHTLAAAPDAVVLIDSWGFTIRVAERLRRRAPHLTQVKYVGPQVWAWRPKRAASLARVADHVLTLQPFEPPYFEAFGLPATFVGHPVFDTPPAADPMGFRARHAISPDQKLVALLYGSRRTEAQRLATPFAEAVRLLEERYGHQLAIVTPVAQSIEDQIRTLVRLDDRLTRVRPVRADEKHHAFAAADVALACSGTVVTELAMAQTPTVVAYRLDTITFEIAKRLVKAETISLVNMAAGEKIIPEFVQEEAQGPALADAVSRYLDDDIFAAQTRSKLREAVASMRGQGGPASLRAADAVLMTLNDTQLHRMNA